jgi:RNA polymerase sigma factor (sigma-70 family)
MYPSDQEILNYFRNNENEIGLNYLIKKYQQKVYMIIRRIVVSHEDANDITQNVFIKIWKKIGSFREESNLYTWIYRIAVNEALSFIRKRKNILMIPFIDVESKLEENLREGTYISGEDIQIKLQKAVLKLPEKQRIVFNLRYFDELNYQDMSEVLSTSIGSLKASYHHAVKKIEKLMLDD